MISFEKIRNNPHSGQILWVEVQFPRLPNKNCDQSKISFNFLYVQVEVKSFDPDLDQAEICLSASDQTSCFVLKSQLREKFGM